MAAACRDDLAAPGVCPSYCPADSVATVDAVLFPVTGDSAYRPYVQPHEIPILHLATLASLDSRAVILMNSLTDSLAVGTTQTPVASTDFVRFTASIVRRDSTTKNLRLALYRLPVTLDSSATFGGLAPYFDDSLLIRRVNVDTLLARSGAVDSTRQDSICGDTLGTKATGAGGRVDTLRVDRAVLDATGRIALTLVLDTARAPYVVADSGRLGIGVRVEADTLAEVAVGSREGPTGASVTWFQCFDSTASRRVRRVRPAQGTFDSFVFSPDTTPLGTDLVVGGVLSARSLLRFNIPPGLLDSNTVVRASLLLLPTAPAAGGIPADSFRLEAWGVQADIGAKTLLLTSVDAQPVAGVDGTTIRLGSADTVRLEIGRLLQLWAARRRLPRAVVLRAAFEGASPAIVRLGPSWGPAALRPRLHVTYVPRFPFQNP